MNCAGGAAKLIIRAFTKINKSEAAYLRINHFIYLWCDSGARVSAGGDSGVTQYAQRLFKYTEYGRQPGRRIIYKLIEVYPIHIHALETLKGRRNLEREGEKRREGKEFGVVRYDSLGFKGKG